MLTPAQKYEASRLKSGVALIPVFNTDSFRVQFSTRHGNMRIRKGDGSSEISVTPAKMIDATINSALITTHLLTYGSLFSGNIEVTFLNGKNDVYSFYLQRSAGSQSENLNIGNFGDFVSQFPNLYSYEINIFGGVSIINGNFLQVPPSVERIRLYYSQISGSPTIDFDGIPINSNLKWLRKVNISTYTTIVVKGDLSKIPINCYYVNLEDSAAGSAIRYTAGKVWASSFDTLSIPVSLTTAELDNLLIDMDNSITTKIGAGVIALGGFRSATSDAAVASLQAKGFTVNVKVKNIVLDSSVIFRMDFQNNYNVWSNSLIDITSGNGVGSDGNLPTFALSGRKPGEYCAVFNGSQSIKTTTNLPINSDKVTVVFAIKTTQSTGAAIFELSPDWASANAFVASINNSKMSIGEQVNSSTRNIRASSANINDNTWKHITVVFDRANPTATKITLYIDGALAGTTATTNGSTSGNFVNNIAFIGQRAGNTLGFNGSLMRLKAYNYPLTPAEIAADYNAFL